MPTVMEEEEANGVVEVAEGQEVIVECLKGFHEDEVERRQEAWDNLTKFAETNPEEFAKFSSNNAWTSLLKKGEFCFTLESVEAVKLFLKRSSYEPQHSLMDLLRDYLPLHLEYFLQHFRQRREYEQMKEGALVVASFYLNQPALLPEDLDGLQKTAINLFHIIASLPEPVRLSGGEQDQDQMTIQHIVQVAELVGLLLQMMNKHNAVFEVVLVKLHICLKTHCQLPPTSLIPLVVSLPWDRVSSLAEEDPKHVLEALLRLLCSCSFEGLNGVIDHFVQLLEKEVWIIKSVAVEVIREMLVAMLDPNLRGQLESIFFTLLYGCQTSPRVFNQILPCLYWAIKKLLDPIDGSVRVAEKLVEAAVFHYFSFPGLVFPGELMQIVQPSLSTQMWCELASKVWVPPGYRQPARGLVNLGNTCYLNSVVQALRFTPELVDQLQIVEESAASQPVLSSIKQLILCLTMPSACLTVSPFDFLVTSRPPWFAEGEQQDCSEFLTALLATIHDEQWKEDSKKGEDEGEGVLAKVGHFFGLWGTGQDSQKEGEDDITKEGGDESTKEGEDIPKESDFVSVVRQVFGGKIKSSRSCHGCGTVSTSEDWFTDLHLPVPDQMVELKEAVELKPPELENLPGISVTLPGEMKEVAAPLKSLLDAALADEVLEGNNQYQCDVCNSLRDATKTLKVVEAPNVLILVLLRFKYDAESQCRKKLTTLVEYPDTLMVGEENYKLKNVVVHSGLDSGEGHYYTWAMTQEGNWLVLSDCYVKEENWQSFLASPNHQKSDTPYLLFYVRELKDGVDVPTEEDETSDPATNPVDLSQSVQTSSAEVTA